MRVSLSIHGVLALKATTLANKLPDIADISIFAIGPNGSELAEVTFFTDNPDLALAIVAAINLVGNPESLELDMTHNK